jgi:hypothetical protein
VFVNYSQDLSTETYLKRTIGTKPAGLPEDAQFVTLTLVNIPGSVQYQVFGSKASVQVNTSLPAKDFLMDYVKAEDAGVRLEDGIIISQLEYQQFTDEFNERYGDITDSESDCGLFSYASQYYRLYKKFNNKGLAWYGVTVKIIICATAYENCSGKDVEAYFCGFANALAQELDWISMYEALEGISITEEDVFELLACSLREYDTNDSNKNHLGLTLFKCITGMEVGELGDRIRAFVSKNWNDPYYHGQATAFILTFISPYKGAVVSKVKKLPLYKIRVDKLDNLAKAKNVDELVAKADDLAKGADDFADYVKTLKTKVNPRRDYPDGIFERHVTGDDIQYEAIGGGEKIWADGINSGKKALLDAKHNPGTFYTIESYNQKPFLYGDLEDEFRRYSKIISDKSNPVDELIIFISQDNQSSVKLFEHLGSKYKVPVKIELVPWKP